jgi:hypothetical protein
MSTSTRTQWHAQPTAGHNVHGQTAIYSEADGKDIALVYDGDAHAARIASTPDLLEALSTLQEAVHECHPTANLAQLRNAMSKADDAIARAEGRV